MNDVRGREWEVCERENVGSGREKEKFMERNREK